MDNNFNETEIGFIKHIMENSDSREERVGDFIVKHDYGSSAYYDGPGGDVVIPEELDRYCSLHFNNGAAIRSITFPGNKRRISHVEFGIGWYNNKHIEELIFEEGIEEIESVFQECKNLRNVVLPESLKYLGNNAFKGSPWIKQACAEVDKCTYTGNFLISSEKDIKEAIIRPGTRMICKNAFAYRHDLKHVDIPDSVGTIGAMAFCGCTKLLEVTAPESVQKIEPLAFTGCKSLKKIEVLNQKVNIATNLLGSEKSEFVVIPEYAYIPNLRIDKAEPIQREAFAIAFLTSFDRHSEEEKEKYIPYVKRQGKKLTKKIIELKNMDALKNIAPLYFNKKNIDEIIDIAQENGSVGIVAFLMKWKNANVDPVKEAKRLEKAIDKDPFNAADMKKLWISSKTFDGTLKITKFKGNNYEQTIVVPERIGKTPVTVLACRNFEKVFPANVRTIVLPEGLVAIDGAVFRSYDQYNDLQPIQIPESVKIISFDAFNDNCKPLDLDERYELIGHTYYRKKGLRKENGMIIVDDLLCGADGIDPYSDVWIIPEGIKVHHRSEGLFQHESEEFPYLYFVNGEMAERKTGIKGATNKGSIIEFGMFPQSWEGKLEPIKWEILDASDNTIVAISKDIIAPIPMAKSSDAVLWEETELRRWLNSIFYEYSFSDEEKAFIVSKRIDDNMEDMVSLLNYDEFRQYYNYGGKESMKSFNSYSTAWNFYSISKKTNTGSWWLRSDDRSIKRFDNIGHEGTTNKRQEAYFSLGVCPVIYLKMTKY